MIVPYLTYIFGACCFNGSPSNVLYRFLLLIVSFFFYWGGDCFSFFHLKTWTIMFFQKKGMVSTIFNVRFAVVIIRFENVHVLFGQEGWFELLYLKPWTNISIQLLQLSICLRISGFNEIIINECGNCFFYILYPLRIT